jgi:DNA mismatch endonuclease, patch repair protein
MVDVFSRQRRSEIMARVKGTGNKATELRLIQIFRKNGLVGWRRNCAVFGRPDFVFPTKRVAIFVDGCFWHCCPMHGEIPTTNRNFWQKKLARNKNRDSLVNRTLKKRGWTIIRLWQHDLQKPERVVRRLSRRLSLR